jgi:hypothetical protein
MIKKNMESKQSKKQSRTVSSSSSFLIKRKQRKMNFFLVGAGKLPT